MKLICDFCHGYLDDTDKFCPNCGAVNEHLTRFSNGVPKTIAELKQYALNHNLPLEQMRFFIGENYTAPKAFGIYEENGIFTVYKNKADGSRAIRYRGSDEAYAVNELYQKMHSEIMARKSKPTADGYSFTPIYSMRRRRGGPLKTLITTYVVYLLITVSVLAAIFFTSIKKTPGKGYYKYNNQYYYYQNNHWYGYNNDHWFPVSPGSGLTDHYNDYFQSYSYDNDYNIEDFSSSDYYTTETYRSNSSYDNDSDSDWNNSWDNDDSWDSNDSWDYNDTDWDSDW